MSFDKDAWDKQTKMAEEELVGLIAKATRRLAVELFDDIVLKTPVDTGRARGAWTLNDGPPAPGDPGEGQTRSAPTGAEAQLGAFDPQTGTLHIHNNVPYIERLEAGHSKQAPAAFVATTLSSAQSKLDVIVDVLIRG